jgi:hypothetical protein
METLAARGSNCGPVSISGVRRASVRINIGRARQPGTGSGGEAGEHTTATHEVLSNRDGAHVTARRSARAITVWVARCLRMIVIQVRATRRMVIRVADRHVRRGVVGDHLRAELHKPRGIHRVGDLLAHERVPRKCFDTVPVDPDRGARRGLRGLLDLLDQHLLTVHRLRRRPHLLGIGPLMGGAHKC